MMNSIFHHVLLISTHCSPSNQIKLFSTPKFIQLLIKNESKICKSQKDCEILENKMTCTLVEPFKELNQKLISFKLI